MRLEGKWLYLFRRLDLLNWLLDFCFLLLLRCRYHNFFFLNFFFLYRSHIRSRHWFLLNSCLLRFISKDSWNLYLLGLICWSVWFNFWLNYWLGITLNYQVCLLHLFFLLCYFFFLFRSLSWCKDYLTLRCDWEVIIIIFLFNFFLHKRIINHSLFNNGRCNNYIFIINCIIFTFLIISLVLCSKHIPCCNALLIGIIVISINECRIFISWANYHHWLTAYIIFSWHARIRILLNRSWWLFAESVCLFKSLLLKSLSLLKLLLTFLFLLLLFDVCFKNRYISWYATHYRNKYK